MPFVAAQDRTTFNMHGVTFSSLTSPSRGARENSVWIVTIPPGLPGAPHHVTREETFVVLEGTGSARVGSDAHALGPGCALVVPANTELTIEASGDVPLRAVVVLPVGGQAVVGDSVFTPPWAQ